MENNGDKAWSRPWTTKEMVAHASNWSLAADVGLLKHLEQFSDNLLAKTEETNTGLEKHLQHLQNISLSLEIAKSKFLSLQNTQFIENRVYEDDETEVISTDETVQDKKLTETNRKEVMKTAVLSGLKILDKYYDKIEVPASDSEEEDSSTSFVLRPKDPYLSRHVPYIIGSDEWHKKWHVGLIESSSDSEGDKVSEKYSDTESEVDLPVTNRGYKNHVSDAVSDDSDKLFIPQPTASTAKYSESCRSSDNEETNSISYQAPVGTNIFAEELAAKLGNVLTGTSHSNTYVEPEINRRPIQTHTNHMGGFFDDEPPPFEENQEESHQSQDAHGIFSGGTGLFDDEDDTESFWNQTPIAKKPMQPATKEPHPKPPKDLFDDEDDIFVQQKPTKPTSFLDNTPSDNNTPTKSKKPIGGVAIVPNLFTDKNDLNILRKRHVSSDSSEDETDKPLFKNPSSVSPVKPNTKQRIAQQPIAKERIRKEPISQQEQTKVLEPPVPAPKLKNPNYEQKEPNSAQNAGLFDDDDSDLFSSDNLFSTTSSKKFFSDIFEDDNLLSGDIFDDQPVKQAPKGPTNIFEDIPNENTMTKEEKPVPINVENIENASISADNSIVKPTLEKKKIVSLFDDDDDNLNDDLFSQVPNFVQNHKPNSLVDLDKPETTNLEENTEVDVNIQPDPENIPNIDNNSHKEIEQHTPTVNDFASIIQSTVEKVHNDYSNEDLFEEPPPLPINNAKSLFPIENNDLDFDDWDNKPDDYDIFFEGANSTSKKASIFDSEPPNLFSNKSSTAPSNQQEKVTPSKNIAPDLVPSNSKAPPKNVNLFDDIFDDKPMKSVPKIETSRIEPEVKAKQEPNIEAYNIKDKKTGESKTGEIAENPKPRVSSKPKPNLKFESDTKQEDVPPKKELRSPPGKLKHNLNINVNALLPGLGPPRKKDSAKSSSVEETENSNNTITPTEIDVPSSDSVDNVSRSEGNRIETTYNTSVYNSENKVEVLQSITKDRAKPIKRRPSTRRARQEQLRKSGIDFNFDAQEQGEDEEVDVVTVSPSDKSIHEFRDVKDKVKSEADLKIEAIQNCEILDESLKTELILDREEQNKSISDNLETIGIISETKDPSGSSLKTVTFEDLFGDDKFPDSPPMKSSSSNANPSVTSPDKTPNLPEPKKRTSISESKKPFSTKSLFDEDSDDDLFPTVTKTAKFPNKPPSEVRSKAPTEVKSKAPTELKSKEATKTTIPKLLNSDFKKTEDSKRKSLFDEDEDSDDIFSTKKMPVKTKNVVKTSLFDDEEAGEDDIFGVKNVSKKSSENEDLKPASEKQKKSVKTSSVKKLGSAIVKDPLDAFRN